MTINEQALEGNWNEIKGKLRDRWGQLSGDELESAHGNVDQLVGAIQQRTGEARASVERYLDELTNESAQFATHATEVARQYAHAAQDGVREATKHANNALHSGYAKAEKTVQERPFESLAACFGAGLITGVVVGLMLRSK